MRDGGFRQSCKLVALGDVGGDCEPASAGRFNFRDQAVEVALAARAHDNVGAGVSECQRDTAANAFAGTGYHRHLVIQTKQIQHATTGSVHQVSPKGRSSTLNDHALRS